MACQWRRSGLLRQNGCPGSVFIEEANIKEGQNYAYYIEKGFRGNSRRLKNVGTLVCVCVWMSPGWGHLQRVDGGESLRVVDRYFSSVSLPRGFSKYPFRMEDIAQIFGPNFRHQQMKFVFLVAVIFFVRLVQPDKIPILDGSPKFFLKEN